MSAHHVQGHCPMGCGTTLIIAEGGYITCARLDCPHPDAAARILDDAETEHLVMFDPDGFTIRHPLRERLDDALLDCELHVYCAELSEPPGPYGTYRAAETAARYRWQFTRLIEHVNIERIEVGP